MNFGGCLGEHGAYVESVRLISSERRAEEMSLRRSRSGLHQRVVLTAPGFSVMQSSAHMDR